MRQGKRTSDPIARSFAIVMTQGHPWRNPAYGWDQILASANGSFVIESGAASWRVSPGQALLIPAKNEHRINLVETCDVRAVFVKAGQIGGFRLVRLSGLLREVLFHISLLGALWREDPDHQALLQIALSQMETAPSIPLMTPWPKSPELAAASRDLLSSPIEKHSTNKAAASQGLSRRTLERRFRQEVGMGVAEWRREYLLVAAANSVLDGNSIAQVGFEAGYCSASAFCYAFKRKFGLSPGRFVEAYGNKGG